MYRYRKSTFVFSLSALPPMEYRNQLYGRCIIRNLGKGSSAHFSTREGIARRKFLLRREQIISKAFVVQAAELPRREPSSAHEATMVRPIC